MGREIDQKARADYLKAVQDSVEQAMKDGELSKAMIMSQRAENNTRDE